MSRQTPWLKPSIEGYKSGAEHPPTHSWNYDTHEQGSSKRRSLHYRHLSRHQFLPLSNDADTSMSSNETPISPTTGRPLPASQTYTGGCHCGLVSYTVKLSPPIIPAANDTTTKPMPVTQCNCSICTINGHLMVYPLESQITWHSGRDEMTSYNFGPARITHHFCPRCGTSVGGKSNDPNFFKDNRALNVSH